MLSESHTNIFRRLHIFYSVKMNYKRVRTVSIAEIVLFHDPRPIYPRPTTWYPRPTTISYTPIDFATVLRREVRRFSRFRWLPYEQFAVVHRLEAFDMIMPGNQNTPILFGFRPTVESVTVV